MKVLVTGGAGYIGDSVVENLLRLGHKVWVVDNLLYTDSYMRPGCEFTKCDVRSPEFFSILNDNYWDAVVHLAAIVGDGACQANPEETASVNEEFVKDLVKSTRGSTKLIFASTCSVYGANNEWLNEDSPTNPLSLYAGTKLNAETHIARHPSHVIFRLGTLFGISTPFGRIRADLVANILAFKACEEQKLTVFGGEQWRPMLHVRDAGRIFAEAVDSDYTGTFILSHKNYKISEVAQTIMDIIDSAGGVEVTDMKFEDLRNYKVSNEKAEFHSIESNISLNEGVIEILVKYKIEGRIKNPWLTQYHNAKFIKEQS
jgi:nucleoside-diphosphate-sugar epimerase